MSSIVRLCEDEWNTRSAIDVNNIHLWMCRFIRELFPSLQKVLKDLIVVARPNQSFQIRNTMETMDRLSSSWYRIESNFITDLDTKLLMLTSPTNVSHVVLTQVSESIDAYCEQQSSLGLQREQIHNNIIRQLQDMLSIPVTNVLAKHNANQYLDLQLVMFGSAANTLGSSSSDIDISVFFDIREMYLQDDEATRLRTFVNESLTEELLANCREYILSNTAEFLVIELILDARVPILKMKHVTSNVAIDICIGNSNALLNTKLLKEYAQYDARVRPLIMAIKRWASLRGINSPTNATLTSYAWTLLVIHFLQCGCVPPVLPNLQNLTRNQHQHRNESITNINSESVGELFLRFFRYFGDCLPVSSPTLQPSGVVTSTISGSNDTLTLFSYDHHDLFVHASSIKHACLFEKATSNSHKRTTATTTTTSNKKRESTGRQQDTKATPKHKQGSVNAAAGATVAVAADVDTIAGVSVSAAGADNDLSVVCDNDDDDINESNLIQVMSELDISIDVKQHVIQSTTSSINDRNPSTYESAIAANAAVLWRFCIQDPFEDVDLGRVIRIYSGMRLILSEIRRVAQLYLATSDDMPSDLFAEIMTPVDAVPDMSFYCLLCGKNDHLYRFCSFVECFICHKRGHFGLDCPRLVCNRCGLKGHTTSRCSQPKKVKEVNTKPKSKSSEKRKQKVPKGTNSAPAASDSSGLDVPESERVNQTTEKVHRQQSVRGPKVEKMIPTIGLIETNSSNHSNTGVITAAIPTLLENTTTTSGVDNRNRPSSKVHKKLPDRERPSTTVTAVSTSSASSAVLPSDQGHALPRARLQQHVVSMDTSQTTLNISNEVSSGTGSRPQGQSNRRRQHTKQTGPMK